MAARPAALRAEHEQTPAEIIAAGGGDLADRATNVEGHVRLAMLEQRIATVETELAESHQPQPHPPRHAHRPSAGSPMRGRAR